MVYHPCSGRSYSGQNQNCVINKKTEKRESGIFYCSSQSKYSSSSLFAKVQRSFIRPSKFFLHCSLEIILPYLQMASNHLYLLNSSLLAQIDAASSRMSSIIITESHRLKAWGVLGEGTGAQLLNKAKTKILTKQELVGNYNL